MYATALAEKLRLFNGSRGDVRMRERLLSLENVRDTRIESSRERTASLLLGIEPDERNNDDRLDSFIDS